MSDDRTGRMWCWAPNPEASGIMGDVCDGCSDNEECMVGVLRERVAKLTESNTILREQRNRHHPQIMTLTEERDRYKTRTEVAEEKLKNLEALCEEVMMVSHDRRMKLEKVESLPKKWMKEKSEYEYEVGSAMKICANELIDALGVK